MYRHSLLLYITILALALSMVILLSCSRKPMVAVSIDSAPFFSDDLNRESLIHAIQENLNYLADQDPEKTIGVAERRVPITHLKLSLETFLDILATKPDPEELDRLIRNQYDIYQATGTRGFNPGRNMLVTGYFQPEFQGSLEKNAPYLYPIYAVPDDLIKTALESNGGKGFARLDNGKTVPYWTRKEIETENKAAGFEMVWLKDPFDAFVLHVQGSGLIRLTDGSLRAVHYAAKNGHPYRSIGKHLVDTERMTLEEANLDSIREYVSSHPEERDKILHHNPSFIFFEWTQTHGAIGNLGRELTAGRSIAVDQSCFPPGALGFLKTRTPSKTEDNKIIWRPLQRFVLVQDTGSAIRGPGRVDLFWGSGKAAGFQAGHMKEKGSLYFLLLKDRSQPAIAHN